MSEEIGLKIGARIELSLVKGCPSCTHNQFYVVAGTSGTPPDFYWLVCARCGNKAMIPFWPFETREVGESTIIFSGASTQG